MQCGGAESWCHRVCQEVRVRRGEANGPRPFSHFTSLSASAPSQLGVGRRSSDGPRAKKKGKKKKRNKTINKQRLESEREEKENKRCSSEKTSREERGKEIE